jgi:DNA-binding NarL/FixJ family response regulator
MPFFMDLHELPTKASPERLAEMHARDLELGAKFGVRWICYNSDVTSILSNEGREVKFRTFCIAEAPSKESVQSCHLSAHGRQANEVREIDSSLVNLFLSQQSRLSIGKVWNSIEAASDGFTRRQLEVLRLISRGMTNEQIAAQLGLSPRTIARHVADILDRAGFANRTEAAAHALKVGLI